MLYPGVRFSEEKKKKLKLKWLQAEANVALKISFYPRGVESDRSSADLHCYTSWLRCHAIYADDVLVPVCYRHFLCQPDPKVWGRGEGQIPGSQTIRGDFARAAPHPPTPPKDPSQKL